MMVNSKVKSAKQLFLQAKQKLDHYRISDHLSVQSAPLVLKLLGKLTGLQQELQRKGVDSTLQITVSGADRALVQQLKEISVENNNLRLEIIGLKDALSEEKLRLQELCNIKFLESNHQSENVLLLKRYRERQEHLREELNQVIYKYNQLMNLIHEDPQKQKQYIKRLLKHKTLAHDVPLQTVEKKEEQSVVPSLSMRVSLLEGQLLLRNSEIARLQREVEVECQAIAIKKWRKSKQNQKIELMCVQIERLTHQNERMRLQLETRRSKQYGQENLAFQMVRKNSALMRVKSKEQKLKKICQQQEFDLYLREKQIERIKGLKTEANDRLIIDPVSDLDEYVLKARFKNLKENSLEEDYYSGLEYGKKQVVSKKLKAQRQKRRLHENNERRLSLVSNKEFKQKIPRVESGREKATEEFHQYRQKKQTPFRYNPHEEKKSGPNDIMVKQQVKNKKTETANVSHQRNVEKQKKHYKYTIDEVKSEGIKSKQKKIKNPQTKENEPHKTLSLMKQQHQQYLKQIQQQQTRINELQNILHLLPQQPQVINQTQTFKAAKNGIGSLVINQHHNEIVHFASSSDSPTLIQRLAKTQQELRLALLQCDKLKQKEIKLENIQKKQQDIKDMKLKQEKLIAQQKVKMHQLKLLSVNKDNIALQNRLNEALQLITSLQRNSSNSNQIIQIENSDELIKLRKQVSQLHSQIYTLNIEKEVLLAQLREMQLEMEQQRREMTYFSKHVKKDQKISIS